MYREKKIFLFFLFKGDCTLIGSSPTFFFVFSSAGTIKKWLTTYYYHRVHIYSSSSIETDCIRTANGVHNGVQYFDHPLTRKKREGRKTHQLLCICCGEPKMTQGTRRYKIGYYYYYSPREQWLVSNETPIQEEKTEKSRSISGIFVLTSFSLRGRWSNCNDVNCYIIVKL